MNPDENSDPKTINSDDQNTLAGAGIDLSGGSTENIAEGEKEPESDITNKDSGVIDMDSTAQAVDVKDVGIKFVSLDTPPDKTDLSAMAEAKEKVAGSSELEAEFKSELHDLKGPLAPESPEAVMNKTTSLGELLSKIQQKLGMKKASVKEELGGLKKMKDAIGKDIQEIKELEGSEQKVREEIGKIETIRQEVKEIEEKLGGE